MKFLALNVICVAIGFIYYFAGISQSMVTSYPLTSKYIDYRTTKLIVNELNINFRLKKYEQLGKMLDMKPEELNSIIGLQLNQTIKDNQLDPNNYFVLEVIERNNQNTLKVAGKIVDYINGTGYIYFKVSNEKTKLASIVADFDKEIQTVNQFLDKLKSSPADIDKIESDIGVVYKTLMELTKERHTAQFELNTIYGVKLLYDSNASQALKSITITEYSMALFIGLLVLNSLLLFFISMTKD